jgi:hypothetical protein
MPSAPLIGGNGISAPDPFRMDAVPECQYERWNHWPVNWTAICVGALASIAAVLVFSLIGVALGAHLLGPEHRVVDLRKIGLTTLALSVLGAFLAFVIGGWVAGKIAGILHSEPAMLHGGIVWLVAVPILIVLIGLGAGSAFGGWYSGLAGTPSWSAQAPFDRPEAPFATATEAERTQYRVEQTEYRRKAQQWQEDSPKVARNTALGTLTALLLGLVGGVVGGWMASGEPMTFTHKRTRSAARSNRLDQLPVAHA